MRPVTRRLVAGWLPLVVLLQVLGALPSFLRSDDPYYRRGERVNAAVESGAIDATTLSERTRPFTVEALDAAANASDGRERSPPSWTGALGAEGPFTSSSVGEPGSYRRQHPDATADEAARIRYDDHASRLTANHQ